MALEGVIVPYKLKPSGEEDRRRKRGVSTCILTPQLRDGLREF